MTDLPDYTDIYAYAKLIRSAKSDKEAFDMLRQLQHDWQRSRAKEFMERLEPAWKNAKHYAELEFRE